MTQARFKEAGMPLQMVDRMKPWMAALMVMAAELRKAGLDPNLGLDKYFFDKASTAGKPVKGLETLASQIDRFDGMSDPLQEQLLRSTLTDLDAQRRNLDELVGAWRRGDTASLERLLFVAFKDYPDAYATLITERNRNWLPQIEACLAQSSPCFVVVGAAHLAGPDGLLAMLQQRGHRVEQQ
jgi:uncharacterized protein YbaP (TraB family)